jgi:hypothetical protein
MAKVFYGSQITDISGSVGGLTFQKNASGSILRLRPSLSQSLSQAQVEQNLLFSSAIAAYNALTQAQRVLWIAFAVAHPKVDIYGTSKQMTGQNWFVALYLNASAIGGTPLLVPPTYSLPSPPSPITSTYWHHTSNSMLVTFAPTFSGVGKKLLIFASPITFKSSLSDRSDIYYLETLSASSYTTIDLYAAYRALWFPGITISIAVVKFNIRFYCYLMDTTSFLCSTMQPGLLVTNTVH